MKGVYSKMIKHQKQEKLPNPKENEIRATKHEYDLMIEYEFFVERYFG